MNDSKDTPPTNCRLRRILMGLVPLLGLGLILFFGYQHCGQVSPDDLNSSVTNAEETANVAPANGGAEALDSSDTSAIDVRATKWCPVGTCLNTRLKQCVGCNVK